MSKVFKTYTEFALIQPVVIPTVNGKILYNASINLYYTSGIDEVNYRISAYINNSMFIIVTDMDFCYNSLSEKVTGTSVNAETPHRIINWGVPND